MMTNDDSPNIEPNDSALAVIEPKPQELVVAEKPSTITPAQARVEAVSNLLHKAYEMASRLVLTPEESKALLAPFDDSDFRTGASGKENLIYIEHAALRGRLNQVFGLGQWSLIVRNRWGEDYEYEKYGRKEKACRIYVEACLLVRGCLVSEAIGDMVYYPSNQQTNYGDAVEGAKSAALRRCAKELGVGLQAWRKDFCESWMKKHGNSRPMQQEATNVKPAIVQPQSTAQAKPVASTGETPEKRRDRFVAMCIDAGSGNEEIARGLFVEMGILMENEPLSEFPVDKVPETKKVAEQLFASIRERAPKDSPSQELPDSRLRVSGLLSKVSEKTGKKKNGQDWHLFGLNLDGKWFNTFDTIIGGVAKQHEGETVELCYEEGEKGNNCIAIIIDGKEYPETPDTSH